MTTTPTRLGVRVRGLTVTPPGADSPILGPVDLDLEPGSRVLLAGPSGAGKTTLLHALGGLLDEETYDLSGTVEGAGTSIGLLQQEPAHAVVAEGCGRDTAFGPENSSVPRPDIWPIVVDRQREVGLAVDLDHGALDLSGGQMQRLVLAGVLACDPNLVLLDEPVSMLDEATADAVRGAVVKAAAGRTLVVVDHHPRRWEGILDRVVVLDAGRVDAVVPMAEYLERAPGPVVPSRETVSGEVVVAAVDLTVSRPDRPGTLLDHLDLQLRAGSITALTGPSGTGKSTLLRVLSGLDRPAGGTVSWSGRPRPEPGRVAWVPQNPEHYLLARTVREELEASPFARAPRRDGPGPADFGPAGDAAEAGAVSLAEFGLHERAESHPMTLSGGEKRRLAIAAALAQRPDLLILDEPTVGLDADLVGSVLGAVAEAAGRGVAVVVATHDPLVMSLADGVVDLAGHRRPDPEVTPPRAPWAQRHLNPLTLLGVGFGGMVASGWVTSPVVGLIGLVPSLVLALLCCRSWRQGLTRVLPVAFAALVLAWTTLLIHGGISGILRGSVDPVVWREAARQAMRILVFVLPGAMTSCALDPTRLGDALGQRAHLPARPVVASVAGLIRVGQMRRTWGVSGDVRTLRGLGPRGTGVRATPGTWWHYASSMTLAMVLDALRSAEVLSRAMDSRGFSHASRRTWARESRFGTADLWGVVLLTAVVGTTVVASALV